LKTKKGVKYEKVSGGLYSVVYGLWV
jgi:hypothetical protein